MKKQGFTLVEILAVIVILGIILAVAVPAITGIVSRAAKDAFERDVKMFFKAISYAKIEDDRFDPTTVVKDNQTDNIEASLKISSENYERVEVMRHGGEIFVLIYGQNRWEGLVACGNFDNIVIDTEYCEGIFTPPTVSFSVNGSGWVRSITTTVTVTHPTGVDVNNLKYMWRLTSEAVPTAGDFAIQMTSNPMNISTLPGVTNDYYLWILASNNMGEAVIERSNVFRLDNTLPTITLNPPSIVTLNIGQTYTDPGFAANDAHSGLATSVIIGGDTVNTSAAGTYVITYNVADNAGNQAIQQTRTIRVLMGTLTFNYTGSVQTWTVPSNGRYRFEVWGSQGGGNSPGLGGYAWGEINLLAGQVFYIYVGQQGTGGSNPTRFNGGGSSGSGAGTGGGASDIRTVGGAWDNSTSLNSRVIVAGGGGGGINTDERGGAGGGLIAGNALLCWYDPDPCYGGTFCDGYEGTGGTQSAAGPGGGFGFGRNGGTLGSGYAGGGGGYYGGGKSGWGAAGGGSSYIGGMINDTTRGTITGSRSGNGMVQIRQID
jgi:prepilin-type N-terminal cleavage/methylation domain-containing protein